MTVQAQFFPMRGGLDQETPAVALPPGRVIAAVNHESCPSGYRRIDGYERFDGRPAPSAATIVGGEPDTLAELIALDAAATVRRNAIQGVPGSGPVRGVLWFDGKLHAWRDSGGATTGIAYYSSAGGWTAHDLGHLLAFTSGGTQEILVGNTITGATSAATALVRAISTDPDGTWAAGNMAGFLVLDNIVGTFVAENIGVGGFGNIATITAAPVEAEFPPGGRYEFEVHNFYGSTGFIRAYGANGVGQSFEFDGESAVFISTGMPVDTPFLIKAHRSHLFLAFPEGSLQHSSLGEPRIFDAQLGAAELGLGHEITNLVPNANAQMLITTEESVYVLTGNDSSDWVLNGIGEENTGAKAYTAQSIGQVIYLDNRGVRSATAGQQYGNFRLGSFTTLIYKLLEEKRLAGIEPVATAVIKAKDLYLLFFNDGTGFSLYFGTKNPEAMPFDYPFIVHCIHVAQVDGAERVFVGATDGFVYEINVGRSFDGDEIPAYVALPYGHQGGPRVLKRYQGLEIDMKASFGTQLGIVAQLDYANGYQPNAESLLESVREGGASIVAPDWPDFAWYGPQTDRVKAWLKGAGVNMGAILVSNSKLIESYTLEGGTVVFSPRGAKR